MSRGVRGGTIIAEDVYDLAVHRDRLADPDTYRPDECRTCGSRRIHSLCLRWRRLRPADPQKPPLLVEISLFRCPSCGGVYTVLPAFIARHLWRAWKTVECVTSGAEVAPRSTSARWLARLFSDAWQLVRLFAATIRAPLAEAITRAQPRTRDHFVAVVAPFLGRTRSLLAPIAAWIHRLAAGVRLM